MKNSAIFISSILLTLLCTSVASAETRVEISNNGSGSKANVTVRNSTSVTNHESSDSSVKTSIKITTNGETKTYESDKPGSVHIESSDGSAKVDVNQNDNVIKQKIAVRKEIVEKSLFNNYLSIFEDLKKKFRGFFGLSF
ncbi:MAG: hypothetical protein HY430_03780 [Candidatus Levybacteria bacterium]|nr:hypothetical protein [Candidatus Levybacteria bacterium]